MAQVTASMVKELREKTGVGMMDCKKALEHADGNIEKAKDWLREKGLAKSAAREGRATREGVVESYVHTSSGIARIGVLVEVNCESDFVAKNDEFKHLSKEIALQVAGRDPKYVSRDDVPKSVLERETSIYKAQVESEGKPAAIVDKIVEGKLGAFYRECCLLDQVWIKDEKGKTTIADLIQELSSKMGEKITVSRFVRYRVGETMESPASDDSGN